MISTALFQGLLIGLGTIIPIGAQNSYVLSQGIRRNHHITAATICMTCDTLLICLGVFGGGALIASNETLMTFMGWAGITFLLAYSAFAFKNVWQNNYQLPDAVKALTSRKAVIATTLAVTLLNPHVYLDTVMILGSIAGTFDGADKLAFASGTILASIIWFFSLAKGAARLAPWLSQAKTQRYIDVFIGLVMLFVAYTLFVSIVNH
ncbi:LysE/ArgO family amino acid transporter [Thalassotalea sp. PLHSN55]|uniref:LysE/ArgO family amino acid transporter n=1 Tax=Thalassotalea sp. PLHSN55 TaxID=3435888 RepID=UPI003F82D7E3